MSTNVDTIRHIGWIDLGDQGVPMAQALADPENHILHVWARRNSSLDPLTGRSFVRHDTPAALAEAVDVLALCVREDSDVEALLIESGIEGALRGGSVLVNHGTGLPGYARGIECNCELERSSRSMHRSVVVDPRRKLAPSRQRSGPKEAHEPLGSMFGTYSIRYCHANRKVQQRS
ncbi:hypothetical protein ABH922_005721 [Rhodococcus sp. 27YEA15]